MWSWQDLAYASRPEFHGPCSANHINLCPGKRAGTAQHCCSVFVGLACRAKHQEQRKLLETSPPCHIKVCSTACQLPFVFRICALAWLHASVLFDVRAFTFMLRTVSGRVSRSRRVHPAMLRSILRCVTPKRPPCSRASVEKGARVHSGLEELGTQAAVGTRLAASEAKVMMKEP